MEALITVYLHNDNAKRGPCGVCGSQPGAWTITGTVQLIGTLQTFICEQCIRYIDLPTWTNTAEQRIMGVATEKVRDALEDQDTD